MSTNRFFLFFSHKVDQPEGFNTQHRKLPFVHELNSSESHDECFNDTQQTNSVHVNPTSDLTTTAVYYSPTRAEGFEVIIGRRT